MLLGDARALAPMTMSGAYTLGMALVAALHALSAKKDYLEEDRETYEDQER